MPKHEDQSSDSQNTQNKSLVGMEADLQSQQTESAVNAVLANLAEAESSGFK